MLKNYVNYFQVDHIKQLQQKLKELVYIQENFGRIQKRIY